MKHEQRNTLLLLVVSALLRRCGAAVITDVQIGLSSRTELYCPDDTVVYTCETVVPTGPTVLAWDIPQQFTNTLTFLIGQSPEVGDILSEGNTGAVANLTVMDADRWVSTLTITNPGSSLSASTVTVTCVDTTTASRSLSAVGLPSFSISGTVTQDPDSNTASEVAGSTVISWSPASVSGSEVTYTVSLDGVAVISTTDTTATLTGLDFNRTYSVSVKAMNVCEQPTGSQLQSNVLVPASVVDVTFGDFNLACVQKNSVNANLTWRVDFTQRDSVVVPPVTTVRLLCNGVELSGLTPSDRQTTLNSKIHRTCLRSRIVNLEINITNAVGSTTSLVDYPVYRVLLPDGLFLVNETVFFPLNPHCSELDPALLGLTLYYRAEPSDLRTGHVSTAEGELVRRSGLRGFQVSFPASTTVVLEYEAVLHYSGLDIETVSTLTDVTVANQWATLFQAVVPILLVMVVLLLVIVVAISIAWCMHNRKASKHVTTDAAGSLDLKTVVPLYEDVPEVTTPTEIKTTQNEAYGPVNVK